MKGLKRKLRQSLAGFLAFCVTSTSFNMVSWADVQNAFENENATFIMSGENIRESAQVAVDDGNVFHVDDLGLGEDEGSVKKEYEKLFGGSPVYEFLPSYDMDEEACADGAELRMFVRVPGRQDGYQLTGDEQIIFLYVNNSEDRVVFRSNIDGYVTQKVSVKGFSENASAVPGGGAAGIPDETISEVDESVSSETDVTEEGTTAVPSDNPETEESVSETTEGSIIETNAPADHTEEVSDTEADDQNNGQDSSQDSASDQGAQSGDVSDSGNSGGQSDEGVSVDQEDAAPADNPVSDAQISMSHHKLAILMDTEAADTEPETSREKSESTEAESVQESMEAETVPESTEAETVPESTEIEVVDPAESSEVQETDTAASDNGSQEATDKSNTISGTTNGKAYNAVLLDESYYAKAYVVTLNELHIEADENGYASITVRFLNKDTNESVSESVVYDASQEQFIAGEEVAVDDFKAVIEGYRYVSPGENGAEAVVTLEKNTVIDLYYEAEGNVVYSLSVVHKLAADGKEYYSQDRITVSKDDFNAEGIYDYSAYMIQKDGLKPLTDNFKIAKDAFLQSGDAASAEVRIEYQVVEGYTVLTPELKGEVVDKRARSADVTEDLKELEIIPNSDIHIVTVNYFYGDMPGSDLSGKVAHQPYVASLAEGTAITITSPVNIQGFGPDRSVIEVTMKNEDINEDVYYQPVGTTPYTVNHWVQPLSMSDDYGEYESFGDSEHKSGYTSELTKAEAKEIEGFKAGSVNQALIAADGSTVINIYYQRDVNYVLFHSNGGSYAEPIAVPFGGSYEFQTSPDRMGYTFEGWCSDETAMNPVKNPGSKITGTMGNRDVEFYAKWKANTAKYSVAVWKEKADIRGEYDLAAVVTQRTVDRKTQDLKGVVGTHPQLTDADYKNLFTISDDATLKYFEYKGVGDKDKATEIAPDGSTIINVYWDRIVYTLYFDLNPEGMRLTNRENGSKNDYDVYSAWIEGDKDKTLIASNQLNNMKYSDSKKYKIEARLDQDISNQWPTSAVVKGSSLKKSFYLWGSSYLSKRLTLTHDMIDGYSRSASGYPRVLELKADWKNGVESTFNYMIEALDQSSYSKETSDVKKKANTWYKRDTVYSQSGVLEKNSGLNYKVISGLTKYSASVDQGEQSGNNWYLYYKRNEYTFTFMNNGKQEAQEIVKYGTPLSEVQKLAPKPDHPYDNEHYVFGGWYTSTDFLQPVDWTEDMPFFAKEVTRDSRGNVEDYGDGYIAYAKWVPKKYDIIFQGDGIKTATENVEYNTPAKEPVNPVRPGYEFAGWFEKPDFSGSKYPFDKPVTESMNLYAKWVATRTASYVVNYNKLDENGNPDGSFKESVKVENQLVADTVTVEAVIDKVPENPDEDFMFYLPDVSSKSITIQGDSGANIIDFNYKPFKNFGYKIQYLEEGTNKVLSPEVTVNNNKKVRITINYKPVSGYVPDHNQKTLILSQNEEDNVVIFYYTKTLNSCNYVVNHYFMDSDSKYPEKSSPTETQKITDANPGGRVTAEPIDRFMTDHEVDASKSTLSGIVTNVDDNVLTLSVYYKWREYSVTYDPNGGSGNSLISGPHRYGTDIQVKGNDVFTRDNFDFTGWNMERNGSGTSYAPGDSILGINANVKLYAQWKQKYQFSATYEYHAGENGDSSLLPNNISKKMAAGEDYSVPVPEISGYAGSVSEDSGVITLISKLPTELTGTMPAKSKTLLIRYCKDENNNGKPDCDEEKYSITYQKGTDKNVDNMPAGLHNLLSDTAQTISSGKPQRSVTDGYEFDLWESAGIKVTNNTFIMPERNVEFTALWKPIVYKINYNLVQEDAVQNPDNPLNYTVEDKDITLLPLDDTSEYIFVGWVDGSNNSISKIPSGSFGDVTVTAVWKTKYTNITINRYYQNTDQTWGESVPDSNQSAKIGDTVYASVYAEEGKRDGYSYAPEKSTSADGVKVTENGATLNLYYRMNLNAQAKSVQTVYDGKDHEITVVPNMTGTGITILYQNAEGGFTTRQPEHVNAGSYTVTYMVKGNNQSYEGSATVNIGKRQIHYDVKGETIYYGEALPKAFALSLSNLGMEPATEDDKAVIDARLKTVMDKISTDAPDAGTYALLGSVDWTDAASDVKVKQVMDNYEIGFGIADLVIKPRSLEYKVNDIYHVLGEDWPSSYGLTLQSAKEYILEKDQAELNEVLIVENTKINSGAGTYTGALIGKTNDKHPSITKNYAITFTNGDLTIVGKLEATVAPYDGPYDAEYHSITVKPTINGIEAKDSEVIVEYLQADGVTWGAALPSYRNVTDTPEEVRYRVTTTDANKPQQVEGSGKVIITRAPLKLTAENHEKTFGDPEPSYDVIKTDGKIAGILGNDTVQYTVVRTDANAAGGEAVGEHKTLVINVSEDSVSKNYEIEKIPGTLVINPKGQLTADGKGETAAYDKGEHSLEYVKTTAGGKDVKDATVLFSKSADGAFEEKMPVFTEAGTYTVYFKAVKEGYVDSEINYADVVINKISLTIKADDKLNIPFGMRIGEFKARITEGTPAGDDKIDYTVIKSDGDNWNLGEHTLNVVCDNKEEKYPNYNITLVPGMLTVTEAEMYLDITGFTGNYDGQEHELTAKVYTADPDDPAGVTKKELENAVITYHYKDAQGRQQDSPVPPSYKQAGSYPVTVDASHTGYTSINGQKGEVIINKIPVHITVTPVTINYGEILDLSGNGSSSGDLANEKVMFTVERAGNNSLDAGTYTNNLAAKYDADKYPGYTITSSGADLTINKKAGVMSVESSPVSKMYDGKEYGLTDITATVNKTALTDADIFYRDEATGQYNLTESPVVTQVGKKIVHFKVVHKNYEDVTGSQTVEVTRRPLVYHIGQYEKAYGQADPDFRAVLDTGDGKFGVVGNDSVNYSILRESGENARTEGYVINGILGDNPNYDVKVEPGALRISQAEGVLSVSAEGVSKIFDGNYYGIKANASGTDESVTIRYKDANGSFTLTESPKYRNVSQEPYVVEFEASSPNFVSVTNTAVVKITPAQVTINVKPDSKIYGQPDEPYYNGFTTENEVAGEKAVSFADVRISRSNSEEQKAGEYKGVLSAAVNKDQYPNYVFNVNPGDFIIGKAAMDVTASDIDITYDGKNYELVAEAKDKDGNLIPRVTIKYWNEETKEYDLDGPLVFTDVTDTIVKYQATDENHVTTEGTAHVRIKAREITITADSAEKNYDGSALTAMTASVTEGSLAENQTLDHITITGSQTSAGSSGNVAGDAVIKAADGREVTSNYSIKYMDGILTVKSVGGGTAGGGGSSSNPDSNTPFTPGGPGDLTVTVNPEDVPLANLPSGTGAPGEVLMLIDDGEVPLAGLPKTGDRASVQGLAALFSGILLAAYIALSGKKKEEE